MNAERAPDAGRMSRTSVEPAAPRPAKRVRLTPLPLLAIVAPGLIVFAFPALRLIARNQEFFRGDYTAGRYLYGLGLITIAVGLSLWAMSATTIGRFLLSCYLLTTPAWIVYSVLGAWRRAVGGVLVTILVIVASFLVVRFGRERFASQVGLFAAVLLVATSFTTVMEMRSVNDVGSTTPAGVTSSAAAGRLGLPNVYHVVLDEFQIEMFEAVLDNELRQALSGFTYYPEARTLYGRTEMSMASVLGPADYNYEITPQEYVEASLRGSDSSFQQLRRAGYAITGYTHLESLYGSPPPFDEWTLFDDIVLAHPSSDGAQLAMSVWVHSNLPGSLAKRILPEDDYEQLSGQNLLPDDAPAVSAEAFRVLIDQERQFPATGRYTLVHLILPHFPYVLSQDCRYEPGSETAPIAQAACATSLLVLFVEELRALGRFDDSTIIFQADHGARFNRSAGGELVRIPQDLYGVAWSSARSRALLLVKPANVNATKGLEVSVFPALLTDVMPTVFDSLDLPFDVTEGRTSLLSAELPQRDSRYYHFYDKGRDGLPDGEVARFIINDGVLTPDTTIPLPTH